MRRAGGYSTLLAFLVVAATVAFWWSVGLAGAETVNITGAVETINEAKTQTLQVAAAFVLLLGALLSIALVVMLYKRSSGNG